MLVDTKLEGYGQDILGHVRRLTDKPVTTIINTHVHFDHSGSNTEFPDTVHFVAHENIRRHMARSDCQPIPTNCDDFQGENAKYLPSTTFSDRLTLFAGGPPTRSTSTTSAAATPTATPSSCSRRRARCTPATCSRASYCRSSTPRMATAAAPSSSAAR